MSVSTLPKDAAYRAGEHVTNRHYVLRLKCPYCGHRYAKRASWMKHIRSCRKPAAR